MNLARLITQLPEVYQPVFGHPELSSGVSRSCDDRLEKIIEVYSAIESLLGRPLKVLDLGCAQGFFSFNLAKIGASVVGVDYLGENVDVCKEISLEYPDFNVEFHCGRIEDFIAELDGQQFDLVLGLSVFHHIVYEHGQDFVKNLLETLSRKSKALLLEFALNEEPLYWASSQPQKARNLVENIEFSHQISKFPTHLSTIQRPLFFVSSKMWCVGAMAGYFDSCTEESHALANNAHQGTRRYFFSESCVVKLFRLDGVLKDKNSQELITEIDFLKSPPDGILAPKIITSGSNEEEIWLVVERIDGENLLDLLNEKKQINAHQVLLDILSQLTVLEGAGLYHDDLRVWNVLVSSSGESRLIDFGSITTKAADCVWPDNLFLSFLIFVRELLTGTIEPPFPIRTVAISPYGFPEPYRKWLTDFWNKPLENWSFRELYNTLQSISFKNTTLGHNISQGLWMEAIEKGLNNQKNHLNHLAHQIKIMDEYIQKDLLSRLNQAEAKAQEAEATAQEAEVKAQEAEVKAQEAEVKAQEAEAKAQEAEAKTQEAEAKTQEAEAKAQEAEAKTQEAEAKAQEAEAKAQEAEAKAQEAEAKAQLFSLKLSDIYSSTSWTITKPIRWVGRMLYRSLNSGSLSDCLATSTLNLKIAVANKLKCLNSLLFNFPKLRKLVGRAISKFPSLQAKVIRVLGTPVQAKQILSIAAIREPKFVGLQRYSETVLPLKKGKRVLYVYVDHTVNCNTNTGVQRVVRSLSSKLFSVGEVVKFVKWDPNTKQCLLINSDELAHLAKWNGPSLSEEERLFYPQPMEPQIPIPAVDLELGHWLIVPEVTHLTVHAAPPTLDLIMWAKQSGLRTGFVFYDAIPVKRREFADISDRHSVYMSELLHADVIWSISNFSKNDLLTYWVGYDKADNVTLPFVSTIPLSGELQVARVVNPSVGENYILSVGTIEPRKNQLTLLKAFDQLIKRNPTSDWKLIFVGNLHPLVADEFNAIIKTNNAVQHLGHVSEEKLDQLYQGCKFTVFPSVEEGFGLPILESLWYGKPCICANFGSMVEVAEGGGCLTINTGNEDTLRQALLTLIDDSDLLVKLKDEAVKRAIPSWNEYADTMSKALDAFNNFANKMGLIYYWIDATISFSKNTGIQRVSRQLARAMMEEGASLIPVKWDHTTSTFVHVNEEALAFFAKWNGPDVSLWHPWVQPESAPEGSWFFMPDLPLNRSPEERLQLLNQCSNYRFKTASVFYDAIPWKMRDIYPEHFANAHYEYMKQLNLYDLVLPISYFTQEDLIGFLGAELERPQSLAYKIRAVPLPGEFSEVARTISPQSLTDHEINVLVVGTVEPRKNHETLLQAFDLISQENSCRVNLIIAGGGHSIDPTLADKVRKYIDTNQYITWEESADDARLSELYQQCHFTVYPSVEEGFGLPILESLWYGKPCICANFGSMAEVAEGGGCLTVDVRDKYALAEKIRTLVEDRLLRDRLTQQAVTRDFKTWASYALQVLTEMSRFTEKMVARSEVMPTNNDVSAFIDSSTLKARPTLSVCISTYNRAKWLEVSLRNWSSLYPEPIRGVELFVCDNASTDNTEEIVQPYLSRADFSYHRNVSNVGMLGNLRETANRATGEYIWILGDDDLIKPGSIEKLLNVLCTHKNLALVYLNYAYTRIEDATTIKDFDRFFKESTPIVPSEEDQIGQLKSICARNENFFTAIYTLVFRRDHAIKAYSQNTNGRPFSSMLTSIPTSYYVLNNMMDENAFWVGEPQLVVNMNVSWMKYAPIWILERVPELYELAELKGVRAEEIDRWRIHSLGGVLHYFNEIYNNDPLGNIDYFSPSTLVRRFKHLSEFRAMIPELKKIYADALVNNESSNYQKEEDVFGSL